MKSQLLSSTIAATTVSFAALSVALSALAPAAQATTFKFNTVQVRSGETVVIEENVIENFRRQQREQ